MTERCTQHIYGTTGHKLDPDHNSLSFRNSDLAPSNQFLQCVLGAPRPHAIKHAEIINERKVFAITEMNWDQTGCKRALLKRARKQDFRVDYWLATV